MHRSDEVSDAARSLGFYPSQGDEESIKIHPQTDRVLGRIPIGDKIDIDNRKHLIINKNDILATILDT